MTALFPATESQTGYKTRLPVLAGALFSLIALAAQPAAAQERQVATRLEQLENQIQTLSRAVYRGEKLPRDMIDGGGAQNAAIANFEIRLGHIESQQRNQTGQLEELAHQLRQLTDRLDRMAADYEMRFQQQGGGVVSAPVQPAAQPAAVQPATTQTINPATLGSMTAAGGAADPATTLYEDGFADIRAAEYGRAEKKFRDFLVRHPKHALAANAQYWLAETYYVRGDFQQAAQAFAQGYQDYPTSGKAADSLLKLGLSLARMGSKEDACLSFAQLKKQFPGDQSAVIARATQEERQLDCP